MAHKGYQGIQKLHPNSRTPQKKSTGRVLNPEQKSQNTELAQLRVVGEHVNRRLKIFKIMARSRIATVVDVLVYVSI